VEEIAGYTMASATPPPAISSLVYQAILPSLVLIQTESENDNGENGFGVGAGVIINSQAAILTALHVVKDAEKIMVQFSDGTESPAVVVVEAPEMDIAVLAPAIPPEAFVPATIGSVGAMSIGDEVFAVGHPLGLAGSMSAGVVSGFERTFKPSDGGPALDGLIQFDAAVNPGNSGGPLLNRYGQVVGIVTGLINPTKQNVFIGIGFAVPIGAAAGAAGGPRQ
jgi:S1-C subfamily serine protease